MVDNYNNKLSNTQSDVQSISQKKKPPFIAFFLCLAAFVICVLLTSGIVKGLAGGGSYTPIGTPLAEAGLFLLNRFHLTTAKQLEAMNGLFLSIVGLEFLLYMLSIYLFRQHDNQSKTPGVLLSICACVFTCGCIYIFTQGMLSRDIFVYASYGRLLVTHHANPYFVTPTTFPNDPLTPLNDWKNSVAAYGPLWLLVCMLSTLVSSANTIRYILFFRAFGLLTHLVNTLLIFTILRTMKCSSRGTITGTILYALNPLILLEGCLGGHNDLFMVTFVLLGVLFTVRAEQHNFQRASDYIPAVLSFTLAMLIKFTAAPLIFLFLILMARHVLVTRISNQGEKQRRQFWQPALLKLILACVACGLTILLFYGPFFAGHSVNAIINSFSSPPSARFAQHSLLYAINELVQLNGLPVQGSWSYGPVVLLNQHTTWSAINILVLVTTLLLGAYWLWHKPTTYTLLLASITALGAILLVTPWFFPWYVIWIVSLAALCFPLAITRKEMAIVMFAFVFSASARLTYLFTGQSPETIRILISYLATVIPPVLTFLFYILRKSKESSNLTKGLTITP